MILFFSWSRQWRVDALSAILAFEEYVRAHYQRLLTSNRNKKLLQQNWICDNEIALEVKRYTPLAECCFPIQLGCVRMEHHTIVKTSVVACWCFLLLFFFLATALLFLERKRMTAGVIFITRLPEWISYQIFVFKFDPPRYSNGSRWKKLLKLIRLWLCANIFFYFGTATSLSLKIAWTSEYDKQFFESLATQRFVIGEIFYYCLRVRY